MRAIRWADGKMSRESSRTGIRLHVKHEACSIQVDVHISTGLRYGNDEITLSLDCALGILNPDTRLRDTLRGDAAQRTTRLSKLPAFASRGHVLFGICVL